MTYNEYLEKRNALSDEAQALIDAGSIDEALHERSGSCIGRAHLRCAYGG